MPGPDRNRVSTIVTAFKIIDVIYELDGARLVDIANQLDLAKSTAHRHVSTLRDEGYLVKEGNTYHLSFQFLTLSEHVRTRKEAYEMAEPKVAQLAEETGERAQFMVEENGVLVYVHTALGENAVQTDSGVGKHVPINTVSAGKAILAHMPEADVRDIVDKHGLPKRTKNTITDAETLFDELKAIRERGYATNFEESTEGLRAISVAVTDTEGTVIGAFGISGPSHRFSEERLEKELSPLLLGVANEFELNIQY